MAFFTIAPLDIVPLFMIFSYPAPIHINRKVIGLICYCYKLPQKIYTNGENQAGEINSVTYSLHEQKSGKDHNAEENCTLQEKEELQQSTQVAVKCHINLN